VRDDALDQYQDFLTDQRMTELEAEREQFSDFGEGGREARGPERRRRQAERREARVEDSERQRTDYLGVQTPGPSVGFAQAVGAASVQLSDVKPGVDVRPGLLELERPATGLGWETELRQEAETETELETEYETEYDTEYEQEPRLGFETETETRAESETETETLFEFENRRETERGPGEKKKRPRNRNRRERLSGTRGEGDDPLSVGYLTETFAGFAGLGVAGGESLTAGTTREDLEAQGEVAFGEYAPSFGADEEEIFEDTLGFFGLGGGE
jgi:hypothetical protein